MNITRRSFVKKTSYSAAALSILGTGTALASGATSNVVKWHMRCDAPEANETGAGTGSPPPHPSGHFDGMSRTTNQHFSSDWEHPDPASQDIRFKFQIDGSLQGRAKDLILIDGYLEDSPLYTAVAYLRKFKQVKDSAGNWGAKEELTWNATNGEWEATAVNVDPVPRTIPSHSVTASVSCDEDTGNISGNTDADNTHPPVDGMKAIITLAGVASNNNKTFSITAEAKFESTDFTSGEISMTTVYNSKKKSKNN